jgi:MerR family transcriptional regulator/heat shock protein HspR
VADLFGSADPDAPLFVISVAAELTGMHPQTLRGYDRMGIVSPGRAGGGGRRYSLHDIELLRAVSQLTSAGIGIEGVRRILALEHEVATLHAVVAELQVELMHARQALLQTMATPPRLLPPPRRR